MDLFSSWLPSPIQALPPQWQSVAVAVIVLVGFVLLCIPVIAVSVLFDRLGVPKPVRGIFLLLLVLAGARLWSEGNRSNAAQQSAPAPAVVVLQETFVQFLPVIAH